MSIWISCTLAPPGDIGGGGGSGGGGDGGPPGCDCVCNPDSCGGGCDEVVAFWCDEDKGGGCSTSSIPADSIPGFDEVNCEPPPTWDIDGTTFWADSGPCDLYCNQICRRYHCDQAFPKDVPCAWTDFIIFDLTGQCGALPDTGDCGIDCTLNGVNLYLDPLICKSSEKNCNKWDGGGGFGGGGPLTPGTGPMIPPPSPPPDGYECGADIGTGCICCNATCNATWDGVKGDWVWPPGCNDDWYKCQTKCFGKACPKCNNDGTCDWQTGCQVYCDKDCPNGDTIEECEKVCGDELDTLCWKCNPDDCGCCTKTTNKVGGGCPDGTFPDRITCNKEGGPGGGNCLKKCPVCDDTTGDCSFEADCDGPPDGVGTQRCGVPCSMGETKDDCDALCNIDDCEYSCWDCVRMPFDYETGAGGGEECQEVTIVDECGKTLPSVCYPNHMYINEPQCKDGGCGDEELSNDTGYNNSQKDRVYSMTYVDEVFERNHSNKTYKLSNTEFLPINRGTLPASLFKTTVHTSVRAVYDLNNKGIKGGLFSDIPYSDLDDGAIENSLHINLVNLLNQAKLATGQSIKSQMLGTIRELLISNRIHTLSGDDLINLLKNIIRNQTKYPDTRLSELKSLSPTVNEGRAIKLAGDNAFRLKGNVYSEGDNERMKYWKTLATDLDKNLPITLSDGTKTQLYYKIDDTINLNSSGSITMSEGDYQRITTSNGSYTEIPVQGDFDRARILQLETLQKIMYLMDDTYDFTLNVSSAPDLYLDERYGVTNERKNFYMLTANLSSVTDLERENSFISKTQVTYTYETDSTVRDDWVSKFPFPFMVFRVDADDPIFNYITNGGIINLTTKDFVFDIFDDPRLIRPIRRFLPTVVLIPTDKTKDVPFHSLSKYVSYGVRELTFEVHPDPERSDVWKAPHIKESFAYPKPGISISNPTHNAKEYGINTKELTNLVNYTNITPVLPRPKGPTRRLFEVLKDFKANWDVSGNIVKWSDVYDEMGREQIKYLQRECNDLEGFKSLASMGKIHKAVENRYPKVKEVRSDMKPISFDFFRDNPKLVQKPLEDRTNPPDPLP